MRMWRMRINGCGGGYFDVDFGVDWINLD